MKTEQGPQPDWMQELASPPFNEPMFTAKMDRFPIFPQKCETISPANRCMNNRMQEIEKGEQGHAFVF